MNLYVYISFVIYFVEKYGFVGCNQYVVNKDKYGALPISSIHINFNGLRDEKGILIGVPGEESFDINVKHIARNHHLLLHRQFVPENLKSIDKITGKLSDDDVINSLDPIDIKFKELDHNCKEKKSKLSKNDIRNMKKSAPNKKSFIKTSNLQDSEKMTKRSNTTTRNGPNTVPTNKINVLPIIGNTVSALPAKIIIKKPVMKQVPSWQKKNYKPLLPLKQTDKKNNKSNLPEDDPLIGSNQFVRNLFASSKDKAKATSKKFPLFSPLKKIVIQPIITQNASDITNTLPGVTYKPLLPLKQ